MEYNLKNKKPESLCCIPETKTTLYINYTLVIKIQGQVLMLAEAWE